MTLLIFFRSLGANTVMNGYQVPQGTFVLRTGILNQRYFKQPDLFLPERWMRGK